MDVLQSCLLWWRRSNKAPKWGRIKTDVTAMPLVIGKWLVLTAGLSLFSHKFVLWLQNDCGFVISYIIYLYKVAATKQNYNIFKWIKQKCIIWITKNTKWQQQPPPLPPNNTANKINLSWQLCDGPMVLHLQSFSLSRKLINISTYILCDFLSPLFSSPLFYEVIKFTLKFTFQNSNFPTKN